MSLIKEQQDSSKRAAAPRPVVVRRTKSDPLKVMLRWVYWLVLIGVVAGVVLSSIYTGISMYKGLN